MSVSRVIMELIYWFTVW